MEPVTLWLNKIKEISQPLNIKNILLITFLKSAVRKETTNGPKQIKPKK